MATRSKKRRPAGAGERAAAPVRFLLNGAPHAESGVAPTMTVLDYLRTVRHLTGTKEGCAEGDCGACTILLGRRVDGKLRYDAVNSCLMMVPQLDGAAVVTVEGLAAPDGPLHPVQQAMVETDGTQCGFCTPGFVMAMAAFRLGGEPATDTLIHEALAGNLCRCTGYRPIVDAMKRAAGGPPDRIAAAAPATDKALAALPACETYAQGEQVFLAPRSLHALAEARAAHPAAALLAGGTDLGLKVSKDREKLPLVISTAFVPELRRIAAGRDVVELGAAVTYSAALATIDAAFPAMAAMMRRLGSRQIRNLGTFGGNLGTASPIGDTLPCLLALEATLTLRSTDGSRTLSVDDFFLGYRKTALRTGEFIEAIRLPRLEPGEIFQVYKLSKRFDQDISAVIGAFRLEIQGGRVKALRAAYGGMAATPKRARALETALIGRPWTAEALADVDALLAEDFQPIDDMRATAAYRRRAAANLVRRLQLETAPGGAPARLEAL
jgi:xanthine dehydrogenase small subunit